MPLRRQDDKESIPFFEEAGWLFYFQSHCIQSSEGWDVPLWLVLSQTSAPRCLALCKTPAYPTLPSKSQLKFRSALHNSLPSFHFSGFVSATTTCPVLFPVIAIDIHPVNFHPPRS
jgi:hypothetical protein